VTNQAQTPLSDRLRSLVDTVQHNERTLRRFQNIELRLIGAQDFASFLYSLFSHLPTAAKRAITGLTTIGVGWRSRDWICRTIMVSASG
jgi:uncharacterized protein YigA (DUF484 family)